METLLKQLTEAVGVSGDEYEVRRLIRDLIREHVDDWWVDALGNLLALKKGTGANDLRVLVDAHMDEVGLIVTGIDSSGHLQFDKLGSIDDRVLAGATVQVGRNKIKGVIGIRPIHLIKNTERAQVTEYTTLRIDIGAQDDKEAGAQAAVGDRGTFFGRYQSLGPTAISKAFDNRAGCAALIQLLQGERYPFDLYAVFSVQEEIGLRGAIVAANAIAPDIALVLECTPAYDLPTEQDVNPNTYLGRGPCIYVMDNVTIQDPRLVRHLITTAAKHNLPYQIRQPGGGGTNTGRYQRALDGIPAATLGLPGRHAHTACTIIHLADYENYVKMADAALRALDRSIISRQ